MLRDARHHAVEDVAPHHGALAPHRARLDADHAVEPDLAVAALGVPRAGPDVEPVATPPGLVARVARVVLAREHDAEQPVTVRPDEQHGPVLALREVLLEGHPGPDDLPGVRVAVEPRRVLRADATLVVAGVRAGAAAARSRAPGRLAGQGPSGVGPGAGTASGPTASAPSRARASPRCPCRPASPATSA
ncbi:hypothetical protein FB00_11335 [Cellulosimicrobium funkei]|uniref:Uncharacterized protein n=1 Tax=Cellulosimicrobium funkei TaxID=264251 RepID=A0A0H2KM40_9MICO|nr:hypothetical protein FB00_11335 [Cellulosimicrobium funkei]